MKISYIDRFQSIRPSKRGAGNRVSIRHASLDDLDAADSLPLVSLPYDLTSSSTPSNQSQVQVKAEPSVQRVAPDDRMVTESTSSLFSGGITRQPLSYPSTPEGIRQPSAQFRTGSLAVKTHDSGQGQNALYSNESGLLQMLDNTATINQLNSNQPVLQPMDLPPPALQESFMDTYFQFCYTWCPILDNSTLFSEQEESNSVLLNQALALLGSRIQPSVLQHYPPIVYYNRAKALFHGNHESNPITCMKALLLFYWWGSAPNSPSLDTVWWWTGVAIRLAQQIGLHREPKPGQVMRPNETPGLRRRIWWTLFVS